MPALSPFLEDRHVRVRAALGEPRLDALVVTHAPNVRYLSNHAGSAGLLVLTREAVDLVIDFRYTEAAGRLQASPHACPGLRLREVPDSYDEALVDLLAELDVVRVGIEAVHLPVARFEWLRRAFEKRTLPIVLVQTERIVERARLVKDAWELHALREAASRLGAVAEAGFRAVRVGAAERQVADTIEQSLREAGFDRIAFDTIVASGPHAARPHHRAGDRRLQAGDLVVLDFGGVLDGYCCDLTRTVVVGAPGPDVSRVYEAVRDAQAAAIAAARPGIPASEVDGAARAVLEARGLGQAFGHGTGHGLGLEVHEEPRVGKPRPDVPAVVLERGMVFTIEPGAYLPGWGGVRIEDDVVITTDGCEVLTSVPRDLLIR
ncbi:MAG: M24 family metallopeptidase [Vicinamibacterales bacterium]